MRNGRIRRFEAFGLCHWCSTGFVLNSIGSTRTVDCKRLESTHEAGPSELPPVELFLEGRRCHTCTPDISVAETRNDTEIVIGILTATGNRQYNPPASWSSADYPDRPVRIIVPVAARGGSDILVSCL